MTARVGRGWRTARAVIAPTLLYCVVVAFSVWHLRLLEQPAMGSGLYRVAAVAAAPALLAALSGGGGVARRYLLLLPPTLVGAIGVTTGHWPSRHLRGSDGYLTLVRHAVGGGVARWVHTVLPYDPSRLPDLRVVVLLATFVVFAALAAALIVFRAPFAASALALVPFLVTSTVFRLSSQTLRSALMLAIILTLVGVLAPRARRFGQLLAGGLAGGLALGVVALPGVAKAQFFDWQQVGKGAGKGTTVAYVWNQTYGPLRRPKEATTLLRVVSNRPTYLRTTVLTLFDGLRWVEGPWEGLSQPAGRITYPAGVLSGFTTKHVAAAGTVRIENLGLDSTWLPTPTETVTLDLPRSFGMVVRTVDGPIQTTNTLPIGATYSVVAVPPTPTSQELQAASVGTDATERELLDAQVQFPAWGAPGREAIVAGLFEQWFIDPALVRWKEAYARAYELTRRATNPYEVVVALEIEFQRSYHYDEKADYSHAADGPLPAFFLGTSRSGYCQMFSGTMATLLRMLGIPARVAEGFTEGRRLARSTISVIDDRAAHAWVEVDFGAYGWVPFEPTPTRTLPGTYSSSNPRFALTKPTKGSSGGTTAASPVPRIQCFLDGTCAGGKAGGGKKDGATGGGRAGREGAGSSGAAPTPPYRPGFVLSLLLIVGLAVLFLLAAKRLRLVRGRLVADARGAAAASRVELERYVLDQGVSGPIRTLTAEEFAVMLHREFGVDARAWARLATSARYGPANSVGDAARIRGESRAVRRDIAGRLTRGERTMGAFRLRSLLP